MRKGSIVIGVFLVAVIATGCAKKVSSAFGGVRMTLQADLSPYATRRDRVQAMVIGMGEIEARLKNLSTEGYTLKPVGGDRISIEVAGKTTLADLRAKLLSAADVKLCWASNLVTSLQGARPYKELTASSAKEGAEFTKRGDQAVIAFGDPSYATILAGWAPILVTGEIERATLVNFNGKWSPMIHFTTDGGRKMRAWCLANANKMEKIAVVVDGKGISVVELQSGAVIERDALIQGIVGTTAEVREIVDRINSKPLSLKLTEVDAKEFRP